MSAPRDKRENQNHKFIKKTKIIITRHKTSLPKWHYNITSFNNTIFKEKSFMPQTKERSRIWKWKALLSYS